jgi:hypothetical protein
MEEKTLKDSNGVYSLKIANAIEDLELLREFWKRFAWHYFADLDFFITIIRSRPEILRPHIMVLCKNGTPETMIVGRIEQEKVMCRIGYKTIFAPKATFLSIVYGGILGNQSVTNLNMLLSEILDLLGRKEVDLVQFSLIKLDSDIYQLAKSRPGFLFSDRVSPPNIHWKTVLPATYNDFIKTLSQKHRYWLRRMERMLEKDYQSQVLFKFFSDKEQVTQFCENVEEIAKTTYQRGLGVGFFNNDETRRRFVLSAEQDWFRGYILYVGERPLAYWAATRYGKVLYLDGTGYDPDYRKYEPGTILFMKMVESIYNDNTKVTEIDFGFGDAFYKERYGNVSWQEADVHIFSRTLKGLRINLLRSIILILHRSAESVLKRTKLIQKIKKYWRTRLIPAAKI